MNNRWVIRIKNLFLPFFCFWYCTEILLNSTIVELDTLPLRDIDSVCSLLILFFMLIQVIFFQTYSLNNGIMIGIISMFIIISALNSSNNSMLSTWIFILASQKTDIDTIISRAYKILATMIVLVVVMNLLGMIPDADVIRLGRIRHSLGFSHPNQLGLSICQLVSCHFYLYRDNLRYRDFLFAIVAALFVYIVPNSQTSFIIVILLLITSLIYQYFGKSKADHFKLIGWLMISFAILFNVISVVFSTGPIKNTLLSEINAYLSYRFSWCYKTYSIYGVNWFGNDIAVTLAERTSRNLLNLGNMWLDNAYMTILLRYGILVYVIFSFLYIFTMIYLLNLKEYYLLILFFIFSVYGIMENGFFQISHNIVLFAVAYFLYHKKFVIEQCE